MRTSLYDQKVQKKKDFSYYVNHCCLIQQCISNACFTGTFWKPLGERAENTWLQESGDGASTSSPAPSSWRHFFPIGPNFLIQKIDDGKNGFEFPKKKQISFVFRSYIVRIILSLYPILVRKMPRQISDVCHRCRAGNGEVNVGHLLFLGYDPMLTAWGCMTNIITQQRLPCLFAHD